MPSTTLTIPDDLREYAERQVAEGRSSSVADYVAGLIREDQRRRAKANLEALILEGLASPAVYMTPESWAQFEAEMEARIQKAVKP